MQKICVRIGQNFRPENTSNINVNGWWMIFIPGNTLTRREPYDFLMAYDNQPNFLYVFLFTTVYYLPVKMFIEFVPVRLRISLAETGFFFDWRICRHNR